MRLHRPSLLMILTACVPTATVTPTRDAPSASPRPEDCEIEFFETDALRRPYDALAEVRVAPGLLSSGNDEFQKLQRKDEMRRQACALAADAVIGVHTALTGQSTAETLVGTAVRFRQ